MESTLIRFLYGTRVGRLSLKGMLKAGMPRLMAAYLHSPASKPLIRRYIRKYRIDMDEYQKEPYASFAAFFSRRKAEGFIDLAPSHFISPCDGFLSVLPIHANSSFSMKGSYYRLQDLLDDANHARSFHGGLCLIFRLSAADYHHYCLIDDSYVGFNHYIEGTLHSVQPIACGAFPVYRLNRRCWTLLETENFGTVIQIEIGAMAVGGIYNEHEDAYAVKGEEMGHFELHGSTVVLLIREGIISICPKIADHLQRSIEYRVRQGMWIGSRISSENPGVAAARNEAAS